MMKKILYLTIPVFLTCCSPHVIYTNNPPLADQPAPQEYAGQPQTDAPLTDQVFYDELSPYGQWINYPDYGYVWQPNVDADFRPYATNGSWVYSDYGWTWASNYSWGWAPFHYGNWFYDDDYGWLWQPGSQWAPAWVTWGQSDDYYGWAPTPPGFNGNGSWRPRNEDWNYVAAVNITNVNVNRYVVRNNVTVINRTTIINNITINNTTNRVMYNRGPQRGDVENITHTKIQQVKISGSAKPGQSLTNNQLNVYRPVIKQNNAQGSASPAPKKVMNYSEGSGQNANQPGNKEQGNMYNGQQKPLQQPVMNQNPNKPYISRPETVPPNSNRPAQPAPNPANGQGNNPGQRPPQKPNTKKDTAKRQPKKIVNTQPNQ